MWAEGAKWGRRSLAIGYSTWVRAPSFCCLAAFNFNLSYIWSTQFILCHFWGSKQLRDPLAGIQTGFSMDSLNYPHNPHQGAITPILQMKNQRFRLTCPRPTASKWLKWDSNTTRGFSHMIPTLSRLEFDARIMELLSCYLTFARCSEFSMWLNPFPFSILTETLCGEYNFATPRRIK